MKRKDKRLLISIIIAISVVIVALLIMILLSKADIVLKLLEIAAVLITIGTPLIYAVRMLTK